MRERAKVLRMDVDLVSLESALSTIDFLISKKRGSSVCLSNVHMCMEVFDSDDFCHIVNTADLVLPDGRPIYFAQRLLGNRMASQVRGQDIMERLCSDSGNKKINIGLYGGSSEDVLREVVFNLKRSYEDISIVYQFSPPFRALTTEEKYKVISDINSADVDILFVGIGCPKQELWMFENRQHLKCVMLGVGAAFDFISGAKKHAPLWMQKIGLEWFFRFLCEPKRLWRRYVIQNPRFIYYFLQQLLFGRKFY